MAPQSEVGFREQANVLSGLTMGAGRPWGNFCAVGGTMGYRRVGDIPSAMGLGILALFAALGQSEILAVALVVGLISQAEHRVKSRRAKGVHSHSVGESHFAKFFGTKARGAELAFALLIGLTCFAAEDYAAGWWFTLAGLGHAVTVGFAERRLRETEDDMNDAMIDMRQRSYRQSAGRVAKPWDVTPE